MSQPRPTVDYTSKDYDGFRRLLLDAKKEILPDWTTESPSDFGVVLIELFSYIGDVLSFYGDRIANEAFLTTATSRRAVMDIAQMLDYRVTGRGAASVDVQFTLEAGVGEVTIPAGTKITTRSFDAVSAGEDPVTFETLEETVVDTDSDTVVLIPAAEGETVTETVAESDGTINQRFPLGRSPVIFESTRILVDEGNGFTEWTPFDRLIEAGENQNAFTVAEDDRGSVEVVFGDNVNGRVPPAGSVITAEYRVGGGEVGNVGPQSLRELPESINHVIDVRNLDAATGGAEAESLRHIRENAPRGLTTLYRAVSLKDFANLTLQVSGVAKARADAPTTNAIVVYAAPFGAGPLSSAKQDEVLEFLDERKLTTINVTVDDPVYVPIDITVDVVVRSEFIRGAVESQVEAALVALLDFENVDFAELIPLSQVYDEVNGVDGVSYATVTELDRDGVGGVENIQLEPFEIPVVGTIEVNATGGILGS